MRVGEKAEMTPCAMKLSSRKQTAKVEYKTGEVQTVRVPRGPGPWQRTKYVAGKTTAYTLYGISMPFLAVGYIGVGGLLGLAESGYTGDGCDELLTWLAAGAAVGFVVGYPLYNAACYVDEHSVLEETSVHAVLEPSKQLN